MAERTMIERVARALAATDNGAPTTWKLYADDARIAIAAMREPTEAMKQAFVQLALKGDVLSHGGWPGYARDQWQGMVDAALQP